jgi:hypothetical protein
VGLKRKRKLPALGHRPRPELIRVPDALARSDDTLSYLRLREVTGTRSDAASKAQRMVVTNSGAGHLRIFGASRLPQSCSRQV